MRTGSVSSTGKLRTTHDETLQRVCFKIRRSNEKVEECHFRDISRKIDKIWVCGDE